MGFDEVRQVVGSTGQWELFGGLVAAAAIPLAAAVAFVLAVLTSRPRGNAAPGRAGR